MKPSDNAQRWTRAGAGAAPFCVRERPASTIVHKNQSRTTVARYVLPSRAPLLALHCGSLRAPAFFSVCRGDLHRHRRLRNPLPVGGAATFISRRLISSRNQFRRICDQLGSNNADPCERHSRYLSSAHVLNDREHSERLREPCSRNKRKRLTQ